MSLQHFLGYAMILGMANNRLFRIIVSGVGVVILLLALLYDKANHPWVFVLGFTLIVFPTSNRLMIKEAKRIAAEEQTMAEWRPNDEPSPFFVRHADALYKAVEEQIKNGRIDARSKIGDAALDYRDERDEMAKRNTTKGDK